jgi:acetyl esterase
MALSQEILDNIVFANQVGFDKMHLAPPAQTREMMKQTPQNPNRTQVGEVINTTITEHNIPVRFYIPEGDGEFSTISFFHGGGFTLMSIDTHDEICRQLCARTEAVVMSVDYALAPENPYPAGINDCINATKWFINNANQYKGDGSKMAVVGDSAGGYMAISTAQKLKLEGINFKAQVVVYPVTDHYSSGHSSWEENKEGYILSAEMMKWFWDNFITDPNKFEEASPLQTKNLEGVAPAFIATANYDPLRDEGKAYADKLEAAGVEVFYENYENVHGFYGTGEMGQELMNKSVAFLIQKFKD